MPQRSNWREKVPAFEASLLSRSGSGMDQSGEAGRETDFWHFTEKKRAKTPTRNLATGKNHRWQEILQQGIPFTFQFEQ
jgi:hypothetical protein